MKHSCRFASALLIMYCGLAGAQTRPARRGFWLDAALGAGWVQFSSDTLQGRSQTGIDGIIAFGGTLSSRVRAGIGWAQWTGELGSGKETWITSYDILVYYYPFARRDWFLEAAVGSQNYSVVHLQSGGERADSVFLSGSAWGPTIAVGWDAPLGEFSSLRPRLSYSYGPPRSIHATDGTLLATGWKDHLLSLDVGLVLHHPDRR